MIKLFKISVFVLLAMAFVGCGGSNSGDDDDTETGTDVDTNPDSEINTDDPPDSGSNSDSDSDSDSGSISDSGNDTLTNSDETTDETTDSATDTDTEHEVLDCVDLYDVGWAYNSATGECKDCSSKNCPSDMSDGIAPATTKFGACVCLTKDGYFYSDTTYLPAPCDQDGDGWITISAKEFVESDDPVLQENARCDVQNVIKIILHSDDLMTPNSGDAKMDPFEVAINDLPLYEPNDRDAPLLLETDTVRAPAYGDGGRRLTAAELNSFTKACVGTTADYNGNAVADLAEWPGAGGIDPLYAQYAKYAYFVELNRGWFDASDNSYHIQERFRDNSDDNERSIQIRGGTKYWRFCRRWDDGEYQKDTMEIGMDFADNYDSDLDYGMGHHSQFKCLQVVNSTDLDTDAPYKVTANMADDDYNFQDCVPAADPLALETMPNPSEPFLECTSNDSAAVGDVGFGMVLYKEHYSAGAYTRGCVNQCISDVDDSDVWNDLSSCAGFDTDSAAFECEPDISNFGKAGCGCTGNYTGQPDCDICEDNWDINNGCSTCLDNDSDGHWTGSHCTECAGNYDFDSDSDCKVCLFNSVDGFWDSGNSCNTCVNHYDLGSDCTQCYYDGTSGYWDIDNDCNSCANHWTDSNSKPPIECVLCPGNWDSDADCNACLANNTDGHWDGADCDECLGNYYVGLFSQSDLMVNGDGESGSVDGWTSIDGFLLTTSERHHSGSNSLKLQRTAVPPIMTAVAMVSRDIDLSAYAARIASADFENIEITVGGWIREQDGGALWMRFDLIDEWGKVLDTQIGQSGGATWVYSGTKVFAIAGDLRRTRGVRVTLQTATASFLPVNGYFDDIKISISHADSAQPIECRICDEGWSGDDCEICDTDGTLNSEHWKDNGNCNECRDGDINGHWELPDCTSCKALWSGLGCITCSVSEFIEDSGQCMWTKNLLQNPNAKDGITTPWLKTSGVTLGVDDDHSGLNAPDGDDYFFRFTNANSESLPTAWQRINLTDSVKSVIVRDGVKLYFSIQMAVENKDDDEARFQVYQSNTIHDDSQGDKQTSDILCDSTVTTTSESWKTLTGSCDVRSGVEQLLVRFRADNPDNNAANAMFDDMRVYFGMKEKN